MVLLLTYTFLTAQIKIRRGHTFPMEFACFVLFLAHLSTCWRCAQGELFWKADVRLPSSVNNWHLLLNHWANLNQTSQEWSLGGTNWKLFKELVSKQNSGCHSNQKKKKTLKNFLSEITGPISIYFGRNVPLVILYRLGGAAGRGGGGGGKRGGGGLIFPIYLYRRL